MRKPTELQNDIIESIKGYTVKQGKPPCVREIAEMVGKSSSTVFQALNSLERKGIIRRPSSRSRDIEVVGFDPALSQAGIVRVPILGRVAAGRPIEAIEDHRGYVSVDADVVRGGEAYALIIKGESMIDAGIMDGDCVIVRKQPDAESGDIIVAMMNGEATVKRLRLRQRKILLVPENKKMKPIKVTSEDFQVLGKVVGVVRFVN